MNRILSATLLLFLFQTAYSQPHIGPGIFHGMQTEFKCEIPETQREVMASRAQENIAMLARKGISVESLLRKMPTAVSFGNPLRAAPGLTDLHFYMITNFPDHDAGAGVKDYNCGTRTYDGHQGTDFATFPFWWKKMDENSVEIVAAEGGVVVARDHTFEDRSCQMCPEGSPQICYETNGFGIQHSDGTMGWYLHMKKNSLANKQVGDPVAKGEFLGIVGSSGNSSGPHLHFEVWTDLTTRKRIDPWGGNCNPNGTTSMWDEQPPYRNPKIAKLMTGSGQVEVKQCYDGGPEKTFEKTDFVYGQDTVYLTAFVTDHSINNPAFRFAIYRPDGTLHEQWSHQGWAGFYAWAYINYRPLPSYFNMTGRWRLQLRYGTEEANTYFNIVSPTPLDLISFSYKKNQGSVLLQWQTENEQNTDRFEVERSADGNLFSAIGRVSTEGNDQSGRNSYSFTDLSPTSGTQFYRLKMIDQDDKYKYSKVLKVDIQVETAVVLFPNPATSYLEVRNTKDFNRVTITSAEGRKMLTQSVSGNGSRIDISRLPQGLYFVQLSGDGREEQLKFVKK